MGTRGPTPIVAVLGAAALLAGGLLTGPALGQGTGGASPPGGSPAPGQAAPTPACTPMSSPAPPSGEDPLLGAVDRAQLACAIDAARAAGYRSIYSSALSTVGSLRGRRRAELAAVIRIARSIAARRLLTPSRLALVYLTLQRNVQWWSRRGPPAPGDDSTIVARGSGAGPRAGPGPATAAGEPDTRGRRCRALRARISRVVFSGSAIQFEYYPGKGLQLQVNGTFGAANALLRQGTRRSLEAGRRLLDEMAPLMSIRNGLATWEYAFPFEAGRPPWTSALSQGTAIEAYTTAAARLHRPDYLALASRLAAILGRRAPGGVRLALGRDGDWFLLYSFAPREQVLNAHLDALVGLTDLAGATHAPSVRMLAARGMRAIRRRIRRFDTGRWSRYQLRGPPADLNYHVLNRDLAEALCKRTRDRVVCGASRSFSRELEARCPRTRPSGSVGGGARKRRSGAGGQPADAAARPGAA